MRAPGRIHRILFARSVDADGTNAQSANTRNILRYWRSTHWRPSVFCFRTPDPEVAANPNVDLIRIPPDRLWRLKLWAAYQRPFDAVFYPGLHHRADYMGLRTRQLLDRRIPVISTIEGLIGSTANDVREAFYSDLAAHPVYCQKLDPGAFARAEWMNEAAHHLIAISPFLERMATARYGNKASELPLGVDADRPGRSQGQTRSRPRVVSAGHVRAHKRPEFFLSLARRFPGADFVWYGEGNLRPVLVAQAKDEAIGNLSFPGALEPQELAREFAEADIFVLPSRAEGVPKVTQEAAQAGLAQIVFGYFETPSVVNERNGYVVWDDAQFAARLAELLDNKALVERMGRAGMEMMRGCTWPEIAPRWEERIVATSEAALSQTRPR